MAEYITQGAYGFVRPQKSVVCICSCVYMLPVRAPVSVFMVVYLYVCEQVDLSVLTFA